MPDVGNQVIINGKQYIVVSAPGCDGCALYRLGPKMCRNDHETCLAGPNRQLRRVADCCDGCKWYVAVSEHSCCSHPSKPRYQKNEKCGDAFGSRPMYEPVRTTVIIDEVLSVDDMLSALQQVQKDLR